MRRDDCTEAANVCGRGALNNEHATRTQRRRMRPAARDQSSPPWHRYLIDR